MTGYIKAHYRGAHRVILGGVPCRVSYLPVCEGGKALMRDSSREMFPARPPRGKADFAKWEAGQARKYRESMKLGARSIGDVVTIAPVEPVEARQPVSVIAAPNELPARPATVVQPLARRLPSRPMTRRPDRSMSSAMRTVSYYRVSTERQGRSGLGLDAQRAAVEAYCAGRGCENVGEFIEVESGKRDDRPQLAAALHHARVTGSTLIISKLDRLSRNASFLMALRDSGVQFVAADMPDANSLTIGIMALVAQQEREAISQRTKDALTAAKARGVQLGNPRAADALVKARQTAEAPRLAGIKAKADSFAADVRPVIDHIRSGGLTSLRQIAAELSRRGIVTARGGDWSPQIVSDIIKRSDTLQSP